MSLQNPDDRIEPRRVLPLERPWRWITLHALLAAIGMTGLTLGLSGYLDYRSGLHNGAGGIESFVGGLGWLALWLACFAVQCVLLSLPLARHHLRRTRTWCIALTILSAAWALLVFFVRPLPHDAYLRGFAAWASANVDVPAIRAWHASLPAAPMTVVVPPASWPPSVAAIAPVRVENLGGGGGILLTWGSYSTWGDARVVFISPTASPPPATLVLYSGWMLVAPGVYVALQPGG